MESCGAELAESAVIPEKLAALMEHVAKNLVAHAEWVGTSSDPSRAEHRALLDVAAGYRAIAHAASQAASTMRALRDLEPAPHEPSRWDRAAFATWMQQKIALQTELAALLLAHAEQSKAALAGQ
jgi:hypothetical protein